MPRKPRLRHSPTRRGGTATLQISDFFSSTIHTIWSSMRVLSMSATPNASRDCCRPRRARNTITATFGTSRMTLTIGARCLRRCKWCSLVLCRQRLVMVKQPLTLFSPGSVVLCWSTPTARNAQVTISDTETGTVRLCSLVRAHARYTWCCSSDACTLHDSNNKVLPLGTKGHSRSWLGAAVR